MKRLLPMLLGTALWSTVGDDRLKIEMSGLLASLMGAKGICAYRFESKKMILTDCPLQGGTQPHLTQRPQGRPRQRVRFLHMRYLQ